MKETGLARNRDHAADIVIGADFTRDGDRAYRLAEEIRHLAARGTCPMLLQTRRPQEGERIAPEVQSCLRRGLATRPAADKAGRCRLLILHEPGRADAKASGLSALQPSERIVVCHTESDLTAARSLAKSGRNPQVFAVSTFLQDHAEAPGHMQPDIWTPVLTSVVSQPIEAARKRAPVIAWLATGNEGTDGRASAIRLTVDAKEPSALPHADATALPEGLSLDRLMEAADVFVLDPSPPCADLPDTIIAAALRAEKTVALPRRLEPHYGSGPLYFDGPDAGTVLVQALTDARAADAEPVADSAEFVDTCLRGPITRIAASRRRPAPPPSAEARPILFLPSNGVGIGHLTRLLAIARQTERRAVFASQAPAIEVIRQFGYPAEYIPSHTAVGGDFEAWDAWFSDEVNRLVDTYDPAIVVYDGNHPSHGLIAAVASRRDCRLVWVRRGMWARTTSRFLANARWCDLVIEPGELAGDRDEGVTSRLRHEARTVEPIRLLEPDDLPNRSVAAAALGLDAARPAVLVQLGSGYNRDLLTLLDGIIGDLRRHPGLQIAVAEWVTGTVPLNLWPDVTILRGFPISQHVQAFDFCVSAAGYNSFHELIGFAIPTIFVANQHPSMDDQHGRAKFAQDHAAAFEISETEMADFPELVEMLMQGEARGFLADRCRKLERPNGAIVAARHIEGLVRDSAAWT